MKMSNLLKRILIPTAEGSLMLLCLASLACSTTNGAGTRVGNPPTIATTEAFPSNLAITSPLESDSEFTAGLPTLSLYATTGTATAFSAAAGRISAILDGTTLADCAPLLDSILNQEDDASCYGPSVAYENHPDFLPPEVPPQNLEDGMLPPGDVGLWTENQGDTDQACAAAQLNERMNALESKSQVALEVLASMKCVMGVGGISLPASGSSTSLLTQMSEMATANSLRAAFSAADLSVSESDGLTQYSYDVSFTYTAANGDAHSVVLQLTHVPLNDDNTAYKGRFSYKIDGFQVQEGDGCLTDEMTEAGSVLYNLTTATDLKIQALHTGFCGNDANPIQSDGLIHADDKFNPTDNPDGWMHNFTSTAAEFDPATSAGNYAFAWQAGKDDGNTRAFNLTLADDNGLQGTAFFGFGEDIETFDGSIKGFICNWAGPGNTHVLLDYAQSQGITQVGSSDVFLSVSDELNIGYAPTNSCAYDGTGAFTYDSDGSGTVDTDPAAVVANDLLPLTDANGDEVFDEFVEAGFELPAIPENF